MIEWIISLSFNLMEMKFFSGKFMTDWMIFLLNRKLMALTFLCFYNIFPYTYKKGILLLHISSKHSITYIFIFKNIRNQSCSFYICMKLKKAIFIVNSNKQIAFEFEFDIFRDKYTDKKDYTTSVRFLKMEFGIRLY